MGMAAAAFVATYRDYTGIYDNTCPKRDTTATIAVHYDAVPRQTSVNEVQCQHRVYNKWESGFAYHFYLMGGKIYQLHQLDDKTIHAPNANSTGIAVCLHEPERYQWRTRINLFCTILFLKTYYGLPAESIKGHGEIPGNKTECPAMDMDSIRSCFTFQNILRR